MKIVVLVLIMMSSLFGEDFLSVKSDNYFAMNRVNHVNTFFGEMKGEQNQTALITKVNSFCNEFQYTSDQKMYGKSDYWASAEEFVINGGGDCEDFVVIKAKMLKALGVSNLSVATKRVDGVLHAVLLVKQENGVYLALDNMRNILYVEDMSKVKIIKASF